MIGQIWGWPQPQVPIQSLGHRRGILRTIHILRPDGMRRPGLHLLDSADSTIPDPLAKQPDGFAGMALVAHLGRYFSLAGCLSYPAGFSHGMRERFLTI